MSVQSGAVEILRALNTGEPGALMKVIEAEWKAEAAWIQTVESTANTDAAMLRHCRVFLTHLAGLDEDEAGDWKAEANR